MFVRLTRLFAVTGVFLTLFLAGSRAVAEDVPPNPVGPWMVTQAQDASNVGLVFYFSPDGAFGIVHPNTQVGVVGTYLIGPTGVIINVFGFGQSATFMAGEMKISGDYMTIDVSRSYFMAPQRVVLQRIRVTPPQPAAP
jgi:hypothetical protein